MIAVQTALSLLVCFALAVVGGALNYAVLLHSKDTLRKVASAITIFLVVAPTFAIITFAIPLLVVLGLLCAYPATLERRLDNKGFDWQWYFWQSLLASYGSLVEGMIVGSICMMLVDSLHQYARYTQLIAFVLGAGFALTPPAISVFRWMWYSSKTRPGFDVPMEGNGGN